MLDYICHLMNPERAYSEKATWNKVDPSRPFRHLRTTIDLADALKNDVNGTGLRTLRASASGQLTKNELQVLPEKLGMDNDRSLVLINLREEPVVYVNGKPVGWKTEAELNKGKNPLEIHQDEKARLERMGRITEIWKKGDRSPTETEVEQSETEKDIADHCKYIYARIPVTDHNPPSDQAVDLFIKTIKENKDAWFHVHCHVGKGRSTTALAMIDMMFNAGVSCDDILKRQKECGGSNLHQVNDKKPEKQILKQNRLDFLKNFSEYCHQVDWSQVSWSEWKERSVSLVS